MRGHDFARRVVAFEFANEFQARSEIAPLVIATDLNLAAIFPVQGQEIDRLENLIGELREGDARFKTRGDDLFREHVVDREKLAIVPKEIQGRHRPSQS
jgi:hypothetical protein